MRNEKFICTLIIGLIECGMITSSEIAPSSALAPFVLCYAYRVFNTGGTDISMPWRASQSPNIIFFFDDLPVSLTDCVTGQIVKRGKKCDLVGMSTRYNGAMTFNGRYSFLQIIFQPHGFYSLFNVMPRDITNKIIWSEDIFKCEIAFLQEKLYECENLTSRIKILEEWLLSYLLRKKRNDYKARITIAANLIAERAGMVNLDDLARYTCMSSRNFERIFITETGMSPKQLCCISRFNKALELKLSFPDTTWTAVAHQSGYFDQMHLIKDFKRFCGAAPTSLLKHVALLEENYITRVTNNI